MRMTDTPPQCDHAPAPGDDEAIGKPAAADALPNELAVGPAQRGKSPSESSPSDEAIEAMARIAGDQDAAESAAEGSARGGAAAESAEVKAAAESQSRRGFFAQCIRDVIAPVASLIEKKVHPVTSAFRDNFPDETPQHYTDSDPYTDYGRYSAPHVTLRPPGALPEAEFESTCSKCGLCVQACPVKCISIDAEAVIGNGFPYIVAALAPCVVCEELACMKACPSGALKLVDRTEIRMGLAMVDDRACLRSHGEDCRLCVEACPMGTAAIAISQVSGRVLVKTNGCVGCGGCEQACPTEPAAIIVKPAKGTLYPNED